ncbi:probable acyl-activating enzyme 5, peroxisomal [Ipomoea triloba]|uniref:probable acyl-activating enzyme 5, peroxisomal n=1 Tax=Ipomoea triloba TaxID=35885 RepID=UPI00125DD720|nr:probable acyl-activating enzyme 5, peroxisomal [Ipomoea triloba]
MDQLKPSMSSSCPLTPLSFLERASIVYGECASVVHNNTVYTWSDTYTRCRRLASSITGVIGPERAQVVSVVAPNIPATYELQFAVPMAGAVINNINTRLDARTVSVILAHGESKMVFVDFQFCPLVLEAISLLPRNVGRPTVVLIEDGYDVAWTTFSRNGMIFDTYEGLVRNGDSEFNWIRPAGEWEAMTLNYTSGTTSSPKGVVHSHRSIFVMTLDSLIGWFVPERPVYLWTLPMFHSNGWSYTWGMAAVGGTNVCLRKIEAEGVYESIEKYNVTHMCGAPVVLNMLANSPRARPLKSPVHFLTGGAPPPAAVLLRIESLGFTVSHGYGLTEVAGVVVSCVWKPKWNELPAAERAKLKARQGVRTLGTAAVDVVEAGSGRSVKRDGSTMGEIILKGDCIMLGYLKNPEATKKCMKNGWLYTGDVGVMHPDGYLEIKDRSKDIIISGGENVSSVEVESVLYSHPVVNEAAVVARPDDFWGETPCAFVSLTHNNNNHRQASVKEMIEFCRERLPHYMVPKTVVFMAELPKTATGKIQKFALRGLAKKMGTLTISRM